MNETIQQIRRQLRLSMNGIASASMRGHGLDYKLNFGVSLPRIKEIAQAYTPDAPLAVELWNTDVRELRILATLLYPRQAFTSQQACQWVREIRQMEIAEQYCANLLQYFVFAPELATQWIQEKDGMVPVTGFILFARLCTCGVRLSPRHTGQLLQAARIAFDQDNFLLGKSALVALKQLGRQSAGQAAGILSSLADYNENPSPVKQEIYEDLRFEFEYYG